MAQNVNHADNPYEVLYEHENVEFQNCLQNIELFSKYIHDYECLREKLTTLADKTNHDIMVPIAGSKLAFMPGYIHHTNEVLVLIGDNYFIEKSTKEAMEFVERRIVFCNKKIEELQSQKNMLQNWLGATADIKSEAGLVDITETWSEEELQKWKTQHQKNVQEYKKISIQHSKDIDIQKILAQYEKEEELSQTEHIHEDEQLSTETSYLNLSLVERSQPSQSQTESCPPSSSTQFETTRPTSKFKASRMKK